MVLEDDMTKFKLLGHLLILSTGTAMAQQAIIDHCRNTSSDTDRIACLEAALLGRERLIDTNTRTQVDPPSLKLDVAEPFHNHWHVKCALLSEIPVTGVRL